MNISKSTLPQMNGGLFLTDGGIETTLIFHDGFDLPYFAAFDLFKDEKGTRALRRYFARHASVAKRTGAGFILESATWRASKDWADKLGYSAPDLEEANRRAIRLLRDIKAEYETPRSKMVISGCVGPRGDGYDPGKVMSLEEAQAYHSQQVRIFADENVDMISAITMTNVNEALGIVRAAQQAELPVVISFTVETDGNLPTGDSLGKAIDMVDRVTGNGPAYYMVNCAHPTHYETRLLSGEPWVERIGGMRANASRLSHAELDNATELDDGDPIEFGRQFAAIRSRLKRMNVLGGCCGTDHRHIEQIAMSCIEAKAA
ncbi:homocysteine S-methyltransferase family protein [Mesorhizobium sp. KR9-304]|uniref:homocysteine S-methyltransferase family protein n=1 Tax=Mesorhizobium sp. KR9-304 TaxID=3156614 RepID=UPI0032B5F264